jgi:hypothetical protein
MRARYSQLSLYVNLGDKLPLILIYLKSGLCFLALEMTLKTEVMRRARFAWFKGAVECLSAR